MTPAARVERAGHGVVWLDNGVLRLGLVPALGGRLLSLSLVAGQRRRELLWRDGTLLTDELAPRPGHEPRPHAGNLGDWVNYGGDKTWPAPQGWDGDAQWAGPPDPVLDSGAYTAEPEEADGVAAVTLTSGDDPRTGLRLSRRFELRPGRCSYRLRLTALNTSGRSVRWALWNVTQLAGDGPGGTYVAGPPSVSRLLSGTGFPRWRELEDHRVYVPHQDVVGKLGFPAATGWLAHTGGGTTLTQCFPVEDGAEYPDAGSRAEVWLEHPLPAPLAALGDLDPPARIVECEVLGPLMALAPGERTTLTLDCAVTPGQEPVHDVTPGGHWTRPPRVVASRLRGEFVAYRDGRLEVSGAAVDVRAGRPVAVDLPVTGSGDPVLELTGTTGERVGVGIARRGVEAGR